jgi:hypothetical protein
MKKLHFLLAILALAILFQISCRIHILKGEGKKITETPATGSFNAIEFEIPLKATIIVNTSATAPEVQFTSYENMIHHIKTKIENNTLHVYCDLDATWTIFNGDDITTQITLPSLTGLSLQGAQDAVIHGTVTCPEFKLEISGAGKLVFDSLHVDTFHSEISGAAEIDIKEGQVKSADYLISGAGKIKAFGLQTLSTSASLSGASKMELTATEKLKVGLSGAGTVKYKGHPVITQDISGVGSVVDAN